MPTIVICLLAAGLLLPPDTLNAQTKKQPKKEDLESEILKISALPKTYPPLTMKRDIFSPESLNPTNPTRPSEDLNPGLPPREPGPEKPIPEVSKEDIIRQEVSYEGYIIRNSKSFAMLNINGEPQIVGIGDIIKENAKIVKIEKNSITVEVDSKVFEIQLKGENQND